MTTRLQRYLYGSDSENSSEDIDKLAEIPELQGFPRSQIEQMYRDYSRYYAAGWLVGPEVGGFRAWLTEELTR